MGEQSVLECEVISFSLWSPFSFSLGWATSHMVLETGSHFLWLGVPPCLIFTNDSSPFNSGGGSKLLSHPAWILFPVKLAASNSASLPPQCIHKHTRVLLLCGGTYKCTHPSDASNSNLKSYVSVLSTVLSQERPWFFRASFQAVLFLAWKYSIPIPKSTVLHLAVLLTVILCP